VPGGAGGCAGTKHLPSATLHSMRITNPYDGDFRTPMEKSWTAQTQRVWPCLLHVPVAPIPRTAADLHPHCVTSSSGLAGSKALTVGSTIERPKLSMWNPRLSRSRTQHDGLIHSSPTKYSYQAALVHNGAADQNWPDQDRGARPDADSLPPSRSPLTLSFCRNRKTAADTGSRGQY
jgi:hypothetical protein